MRHGAGNPPQQHTTHRDDHREAVHQFEHQLTAPDNDRNADQQTKNHQRQLVLAASACGRTGDGDDVVDAHHQIGNDHGLDRRPQLVTGLNTVVPVFVLRQQQLDADPQQQGGTDQLQKWHLQQSQGEGDQDDTQHNRPRRSPQNALQALVHRQLAASQGDHHGVVTAEQNIDHDDLTDSEPKVSGEKFFHGAGSL